MSELFPTAGRFTKGYDKEAVAQFFETARDSYETGAAAEEVSFEEVRSAAFPLVRGGYDTGAVDSALSRLEAAFIQRDRAAYVARFGEPAWYSKIADEATTQYPRLLRPAGERFSPPADGTIGYSAPEVDALMDRLADFFDDRGPLTEADLRFALFKPAKGKGAYREAQVDAFLGRAMYVLLAVS